MKKTNKINLAQLGAGYWGPNLIRNFVHLDEVTEFTVCDFNQERLDMVERLYPSIKTTKSDDDVLNNPDVDAVVIAIPAALHYEYVKRALLAGKNVLVEKPLALSTREAEELVALANDKQKTLMVGHTFLFNAAVHKAKEYIDSGELGDIYYILAQRLNLGRVRQDINVMWNLAPHDISIILYWLNETPSNVSAKGLNFLQEGIEDVVFMDLDFPSRRSAHIHVSWMDPRKIRKLLVVGSKKMLVYDDISMDAKIVIFDKGIDKKHIIKDLPDIESFGHFQILQRSGDTYIPKVHFEEPLRMQCQHFIDCILNGKTPITDGRNGFDVVDILERAQFKLDQAKQKNL
jgi:predicted dehydrogenase